MNSLSRYRQLTDLHRQLPLFFQPWWLDAVCADWDVSIAENDKVIQAVMPFQQEKKWGFRLLRNPPLCPYLGPYLLEPNHQAKQWAKEEQLLTTLLAQLPRYDYCQLTTVPGFGNFQAFHQQQFANRNRLTYLLDVSPPEEELFSGISSRLRQYIKSASKKLRIETEQQPNLDLFVSWHKMAFAKKDSPYPFSLPLIEKIVAAAETHQASLFQTAYDEKNRPVAMLWTPFDGQKSYHLLAATAPEDSHNGALGLLTWHAIKKAKSLGLKQYDFEGSMDKGIEAFFRKFGGQRMPYLQFEHCPSRLWHWKQFLLG